MAREENPESANYWLRVAETRSLDEPDGPAVDAALNRALELNPRSARAWITRAAREEARGRLPEAEQDYLRATQVDHMYKPAWALANFYLRQERTDKFWEYARKCLEVVEPRQLEPASYNPAPLFDMAWRVTRNSAEIRRRLIPPRHFILADYLEYLRENERFDAGADIAIELAGYGDPADKFVLLNFCERLINAANGACAIQIWNAMVGRHTLDAEHLDPLHGQSLTNGGLRRPLERAAFDWRMPPAEGVLQNHFPDAGEVRFEFSGDQPEGVLLLFQSVPVIQGAYRLTFQYRTAGMEHAGGLTWQVWDYAARRLIPVTCKLSPHGDWSDGEAKFSIPAGVSIVRLGLVAERPTGTTRIKGAAAFRRFGLCVSPVVQSCC